MQVNQLRYFLTLAKTENYHEAAEQLFISQPSLHKSIQQLQNEIGIILFVKEGRNIKLTKAGESFYQSIQIVLQNLETGIKQAHDIQENTQSTLSIGTITPAFSTVVLPLTNRFMENPQYVIPYQTSIFPTETLVDKLLENTCDVIFCTKPKEIPHVHFIPVTSMPFYVILSQNHPYAKRKELTPDDLNGQQFLFSLPGAYATLIEDMLQSYRVTYEITSYANEELILLDMVEQGKGIFISTDYPQLHRDNIKLIPLVQDHYQRYIHMGYRTDIPHNQYVQAYIDYITQISL